MEEIKIETEVRLCASKLENLRKDMDKVKSRASEILVFSLQWCDLEDSLRSVQERVENRLKQGMAKEFELCCKSLEIELRAKAVQEAEADLESKVKAEEVRLCKARECVEEFVLKEKSMKSQLCEMGFDLEKKREDISLVQEEIERMNVVLERRRVEGRAEMENLHREYKEEVERKKKDLSLVQEEIEVKKKQLDLMNVDLETRRGEIGVEKETLCKVRRRVREVEEQIKRKTKDLDEIEAKNKHLKLVNVDLERRKGEVSVEMERIDRSRACRNREVEEEIERKKKELYSVHDELEAKKKHLELMNADLERRKAEVCVEMENLQGKACRNREIEEEIERKKKDLSSVVVKADKIQDKIEKKKKHLELVHVDIERRRGEFEEEMKIRRKDLTTVLDRIAECEKLCDIVEEQHSTKQIKLNELRLDLDLREEMVKSLNTEMEETCQHIEKRKAYHESLEALIIEHEEELLSKEKKQKEMAETLERSKALLQEVSGRHDKEKRSLDLKRKELCSLEDRLVEFLRDQKTKEKVLDSLQSVIVEGEKRTQQSETKLKAKQEELCLINKAIVECSQELESRKKDLFNVQSSITDLTAELKSKESLIERDTELVAKEKKLEEKEKELKSTEEKLGKSVKSYMANAKKLSSFMQQRNNNDDQSLNGLMKKHTQLLTEVSLALKASSDPSKLVLDSIKGLSTTNLDPSSLCLIQCLLDMPVKPSDEVQGEAFGFAVEWKETTIAKADKDSPVAVLCLWNFLATLSLAYGFDDEKVRKLFNVRFVRKYTPIMCKALGVPSLPPVNSNAPSSLLNAKPEEQNSPEDTLKEFEISSSSLSPNEVIAGLQLLDDPSSFVLDFINSALTDARERGCLSESIVQTLVSLLVELPRAAAGKKPSSDGLKQEAMRVARLWSCMIGSSSGGDSSSLEALGFLHLIVAYGLVKSTNQEKALEYVSLVAHFKQAPKLVESFGFGHAVPSFIQNLIKTGRRLKAIEYIYSFDMVHRFQPVSGIIRDFLRITNDVAEKLFKDAKNESKSQVVAIDRQIRSLRAAIRCISSHKLDSELQIENLQEHIKSLLKLRENISSKPNLDSKKTQTAKPQNLETEVCSIPSNTPNESSSATGSSTANKPYLKNRGRKRTFSGNIHSPAYVSSDPSNQFRGHSHGYSMEQRLGWSAHSGYLEPGFDSSQWTQAKPSHFYQSHQQF
ncbi:unnamed protein product [Cochlearia groenlandica]